MYLLYAVWESWTPRAEKTRRDSHPKVGGAGNNYDSRPGREVRGIADSKAERGKKDAAQSRPQHRLPQRL